MNLNYDRLVASYLNGDMTGQEREEFEENLKTDPELERVHNLHRRVDDALLEDDVNNLRDMLEEIHQEVTVKRLHLGWVKYAAAVLVAIMVIAALLFFILPGKRYTDKQIFAAAYQVYETPGDVRSGITEESSPYNLGIQLYDRHDYQVSFMQFTQVIKTEPLNMAARFYAGLSLMEMNRNDEAMPYFEEVIVSQDLLYAEQAKWYLALNEMKTGNRERAGKLFLELKETSRFYGKDCREILKKMKRSQ